MCPLAHKLSKFATAKTPLKYDMDEYIWDNLLEPKMMIPVFKGDKFNLNLLKET